MKIYVDYFDNLIDLKDSFIPVLEIENKEYFYSFVKNLISLENGEYVEQIKILDKNGFDNIHIFPKVILNFFEFQVNSKKMNTNVIKLFMSNIDELDRLNYQKIIKKCVMFLLKH